MKNQTLQTVPQFLKFLIPSGFATRIKQTKLFWIPSLKKPYPIVDMPIYSPTGFLDITNATLRTSNTECQNLKIGTGNLYVTSEISPSYELNLSNVTSLGATSPHTLTLSNVTTAIDATSNIITSGNLKIGGLVYTKDWGIRAASGSNDLYVGRFTVHGITEVLITDQGASLGSASKFTITRNVSSTPLVNGIDSSSTINYEWYFKSHDSTTYDLWVRPTATVQTNIKVTSSTYIELESEPSSSGAIACANGLINMSGNVVVGGDLTVSGASSTNILGEAAVGWNTASGDTNMASFSQKDNNTGTNFALKQSAGGLTFLNAPSNKSIRFQIGGVEKARIDADGNVGIGTTSPSQIFEVNGNTALIHSADGSDTHNTSDRTLYIGGKNSSGSLVQAKCAIVSTPSTSHGGAGQYGRNALHFCVGPDAQNDTNASKTDSRMCIDYTGNVGIGTQSPQTNLHIESSGTTGLDIYGGDTNNPYIFVGEHVSNYSRKWGMKMNYYGNSNTEWFNMAVVDDNAEINALTIRRNGNVGIGTQSPNTTLHVKNETDSSGTGDAYISGQTKKPTECLRLQGKYHSKGSGALLRFTNFHASGSNPSNDEYNLGGIAGFDYASQWGGGLCFYTAPDTANGGDLTTRMVIDSSGKVGINQTSPKAKLHVEYSEGVYGDMNYSTHSTWHGKGIGIFGGSGGFVYGHDINHSVFMRRSPKHTGGDANSHINPTAHKFYTGALVGDSNLALRANINNTGLQVTGTITATGAITPNSDDRIKYNEEDIPNALDTIGNLRPKKYEKIIDTIDKEGTWIPTDEEWENVRNDYTHINEFGFIAQDVRNIPELTFLVKGEEITPILHTISQEMYSNLNTEEQTIYTTIYTHHSQSITQEEFSNLTPEGQEECIIEYTKYVDTQTPLSIDYNGIFVVAVKAIQELKSENETLKTQLASVLTRLDALENTS